MLKEELVYVPGVLLFQVKYNSETPGINHFIFQLSFSSSGLHFIICVLEVGYMRCLLETDQLVLEYEVGLPWRASFLQLTHARNKHPTAGTFQHVFARRDLLEGRSETCSLSLASQRLGLTAQRHIKSHIIKEVSLGGRQADVWFPLSARWSFYSFIFWADGQKPNITSACHRPQKRRSGLWETKLRLRECSLEVLVCDRPEVVGRSHTDSRFKL